jgi:hypothetical protein
LIKKTIQQEKIIIVEIYAPDITAPNFIKQTLRTEKHRRTTAQ